MTVRDVPLTSGGPGVLLEAATVCFKRRSPGGSSVIDTNVCVNSGRAEH